MISITGAYHISLILFGTEDNIFLYVKSMAFFTLATQFQSRQSLAELFDIPVISASCFDDMCA